MEQLTLSTAPPEPVSEHLKPQAQLILDVLRDGHAHSMVEFVRGDHCFVVLAVAQRVSEIRRAGFDVRNVTPDGGTATYRLFGAGVRP